MINKAWYSKNKERLKKKRTMETLQNILKIVADYYNVSVESVQGKSRKIKYVKARHVYFYLASVITYKKIVDIAEVVNRDRTSVLYGRGKVEDEISIYPEMYMDIEKIKSMIKPKNKMIIEHVDLLQLSINHTKSFLTN